jgi:hypothetical protein
MDEVTIDVFAAPEMTAEVVRLARKHDVEISNFATVGPATPVSNFPNLDPSVIAAVQQAVVIIGAGTAAVHFVKALLDLIKTAKGKVSAVDRKTGKTPKTSYT